MSRGVNAVANGKQLTDRVVEYARSVGLLARIEVACGRRLWGAQRFIDVVLSTRNGDIPLGIECKWQAQQGSAEEKLFGTLQDIDTWRFPGLLVYDGPGFSRGLDRFLSKHPRAIRIAELPKRIDEHFGVGVRPIRLYADDNVSEMDLF